MAQFNPVGLPAAATSPEFCTASLWGGGGRVGVVRKHTFKDEFANSAIKQVPIKNTCCRGLSVACFSLLCSRQPLAVYIPAQPDQMNCGYPVVGLNNLLLPAPARIRPQWGHWPFRVASTATHAANHRQIPVQAADRVFLIEPVLWAISMLLHW